MLASLSLSVSLTTNQPLNRRCIPTPRLEFLRGERRLRFAPSALGPPGAHPCHHDLSITACPFDPCLRRLQGLVQRIGALCLRPELAHAVFLPTAALDATRSGARLPPRLAHACRDHAALLADMSDPDATAPNADAARLYLREACNIEVPARSTSTQATQHLLAWRVEGPRRVVLFTGAFDEASSDPAEMVPHLLTKALLPLPSRRPELAEIRLALQGRPSESDVRARLLHAGRTALEHSSFLERTGPHSRRAGALAHSLEEAVLAFARAPPAECHARIGLSQTQHWDKDHIDTRCARRFS